jgi:hypothetical protein
MNVHYEDIVIEMARTERELRARVIAKIAAQQLGELWIGLDDRRSEDRGQDDRRAA